MRSLVILISGSGSNMTAILQAAQRDQWAERYNARVAAVISNQADASGLTLAREAGLATAVVSHQAFAHHAQPREAFDAALMAEIDRQQPALVVLAGFMRILTPGFVRHYAGRLLNIHPSLLPAFPGLRTHERALQAGWRHGPSRDGRTGPRPHPGAGRGAGAAGRHPRGPGRARAEPGAPDLSAGHCCLVAGHGFNDNEKNARPC